VLPLPSPTTVPGLTSSSARSAAAFFCASTSACSIVIYVIALVSA